MSSFPASRIHSRLLPVRVRVWVALFALLGTMAGLTYTRNASADSLAPAMPVIVNSMAIVAHTNGYPIRIRMGPGTNYTTLAEMHEGQTVSVLDGPTADARGNRWFKIAGARGDRLDGRAVSAGHGRSHNGHRLRHEHGGRSAQSAYRAQGRCSDPDPSQPRHVCNRQLGACGRRYRNRPVRHHRQRYYRLVYGPVPVAGDRGRRADNACGRGRPATATTATATATASHRQLPTQPPAQTAPPAQRSGMS